MIKYRTRLEVNLFSTLSIMENEIEEESNKESIIQVFN